MALVATNVGTSAQSSTSTLTVVVSATGGAGRIVLNISTESNTNGAFTPVASISGLSATWHSRASISLNAKGQLTEEWYADFVATTSGTVTINLSGGSTDDAVVMAVFFSSTVAGTIAYDTNVSFPATFAGSGIIGGSASVTSDAAGPFVILLSGSVGTAPGSPTPGQISATPIAFANNGGGIGSENGNVMGGQFASALASTSVGYTTSTGPSWTVVVDSLNDGTTGTPPSGMFMALGI